jgi:hypothetical protein
MWGYNSSRFALAPTSFLRVRVGNPESETLVEDGLKLWLTVLTSSASVPPLLAQLLPARLGAVLRRGRDNAVAYRISEGHALHAGVEAVAPVLPELGPALARSLAAVINLPRQDGPGQLPQGELDKGGKSSRGVAIAAKPPLFISKSVVL